MKQLTKAEEQIMQVLWKKEKAFLKQIVEGLTEPRPAYTTVATVVKVLVEKKFVGFNTYGKTNEYHPIVKKETYFKQFFGKVLDSFFGNSPEKFATFFAQDENINLEELESIKEILEAQIAKRKSL